MVLVSYMLHNSCGQKLDRLARRQQDGINLLEVMSVRLMSCGWLQTGPAAWAAGLRYV